MKNPTHFLFVTFDGGGNVPPVLGLARRLQGRGHHVRVLTEPCLREAVEASGLTFMPFRRYSTRTDRREDILRDWNASPLSNPIFDNVVFGPVATIAEEARRTLEAEATNVLVTDMLLPGALIPAEAMGVPRAVLFHTTEYLPGANRPPGGLGLTPGNAWWSRWRDRLLTKLFHRMVDKYLPGVNDVRASYGLSPLNHTIELFHQADRRIIQTCRAFDFPIQPAPANVRYAGPVLDDPDWVRPWQNPWPEQDDRPLVVVSLSSTFQNQRTAIERCIEALGRLEVRGLVTLGLALSEERFDPPGNVIVLSSASHAAVFPHAAAVVTHAGHGTIMRALAHGLPLLCLPMGRDQGDNAARLSHHGAGLQLSPKASAGTIQRALSRLLAEPRFRENAQSLGRLIREDVKRETGVEELESLINTGAEKRNPKKVDL